MRARAMGHLPGGIPARVAAKKDKSQSVDLTPEQRERFAGTSVKQDDKGYFCHTHRARSDSYPSVDEIPDKDVEFIESTGAARGVYRFEANESGWHLPAERRTAQARPQRLYHYTSTMHLPAILQSGHLRLTESNIDWSGRGPGVVWFTDSPSAVGIGVTPGFKDAVEIVIETPADAAWWPEWSRAQGIDEMWYEILGEAAGGSPDHWWVVPHEIPVDDFLSIKVNGKPFKTGALDKTADYLGLTDEQWEFLSELIEDLGQKFKHTKVCYQAANALNQKFGWAVESGYFVGLGQREGHYWNRLPNGTIVDATFDQFDDSGDPVKVVPPGSPEQGWYERQTTGSLSKVADADTAGVMVCLIPEHDASIALMEASNSTEEFDEQHITLLYLGSTEEAGGDAGRERLHRAVYDFAIHSGHDVLSGKSNGWGTFNNEGESVLVALWDIPGIAEFRAALKQALTSHGVPMREENHGFTPHQTMAYLPGATTQIPAPVTPAPESIFTHVVISWGDEWSSVALESALGQTQQQVAATLRAHGYDSRFDPAKHPRGGHPDNPGQFSTAPGGGRGTVVPDSKQIQRTKTAPEAPAAPSPADMPQHRQQAPQRAHEVAQRYGKDVSWRPKPEGGRPSPYRGVSDEAFWRQVERGDVYGMHIPEGKFPKGHPHNDPEYHARASKVEALAGLNGKYATTTKEEADRTGLGGATDVLYDKMKDPVTGKDDAWSEERTKVHNRIISDFLSRATKGVPKEGKCLIMAGPSGAGKSTFLKQQGAALGVQLDSRGNPVNFATINPDDFKTDIPMDMSRYPGLGENETAILKHEESSHLAKRATAALMSQGYNVIIDVTLGSAESARKKYVDAEHAQGYHDYTVALVDGDMANSRQNAGNRYKATDPKTGERSFAGRFIPMDLVESQKPKDPSRFRSVNAEQFVQFAQLPQINRAVVFDPYDPKAGLRDAKAAIHEAIRRNPALASMLRAEGGGVKMPPNARTTEISDKIRAYRTGQVSEQDLVRYLTEEVRYAPQEKCPFPKNSVQWYDWHRDGRPFTPGSFDEVNLARDLGDLPDAIHDKVVSILWSRAVPVKED